MTTQLRNAIDAAFNALQSTGWDDIAEELNAALAVEPTVLDSVALVRQFEVACGASLPYKPTQPLVEKLKLRLSLELEELYEKAQAMGLEATFGQMLKDKAQDEHQKATALWVAGNGLLIMDNPENYDQVALLDACCDQRYVQDGTVLTCGLQDVFYPAFAEVQRSNMSKFCLNRDVIMQTIEKYRKDGVEAEIHGIEGEVQYPRAIYRSSDGKVLKSINYSPAELTQFF